LSTERDRRHLILTIIVRCVDNTCRLWHDAGVEQEASQFAIAVEIIQIFLLYTVCNN